MDCLYGGLEVIAAVGRQLFGAVQQLGGTLPHPLRETFLIRSIGLRKIPLVFFCSPEVLELSSERTIIKIPLNYRTKNHLDAMYFGVIAVAADITGGLAAYKVIRESGREVSLVFKDFKADFIKRIEGDATFTCTDGVAIQEFMQKVLESDIRENMPVRVEARVPELLGDEVVGRFELTLSCRAR